MYIINSDALRDENFLKQMDTYPQRETVAKIITLDWNENPIREISGKISNGTLNVDGSSSCRRTCSLTLITTDKNVNEVDWQIKTKYYLTIGMRNFVNDKYPKWIWFPLGMFIVTSCSLSSNLQGYTLSLQGRDKMCMLDGSIGGQLFATHDFGREELIHRDGSVSYELLDIATIIREAIHVYAHEPYENIIVNDLDDIAVELLDYRINDQFCYIYDISSTPEFSTYTTNIIFEKDDVEVNFLQWLNNHYSAGTVGDIIPEAYNDNGVRQWVRINKKLEYGDTAGYRRTTLTYPVGDGELVIDAGGVLTDMLNKVTDFLGEFEYFYDVYGRFIFQRKRMYHNIVWNGVVPDGETTVGYFTSPEKSQTCYDFTQGQIIESYANKPNVANIRNDWSIWGEIESSGDAHYACHLRYAIDDKPTLYYCMSDGYVYTTQSSLDIEQLPQDNDIYQFWQQMRENYLDYLGAYKNLDGTNTRIINGINTLRSAMFPIRTVDWREIIYRMALDYANARAIVTTLQQEETRLPQKTAILNTYIYNNNTNYNFNNGLENPIISADNNDKYGYYDGQNNKLQYLDYATLQELNTERLKNEQREITYQEYMKSLNQVFFFEPKLTNNVWQRHNDRNPATDWITQYPYFGMKLSGDLTAEQMNAADYTPSFEIDPEARKRIIHQLIVQWENRMNSRYSIYFADMLAFWPLYYKIDNDLDYDDVKKEMVEAIKYSNTAFVNISNLALKSAVANQEKTYNAILRTNSYNSHAEKVQRFIQAATVHLDSLDSANTKLNIYLQAYQDNINSQEVAFRPYFQFAELEEFFTATQQYINQQKALVNNYINELNTLKSGFNPTTGNAASSNILYPNIDAIVNLGTNHFNNINGYYDDERVWHDGLVARFNTALAQKKSNMINASYNLWVENKYWNPNFIYYDASLDAIKFLAPEEMLFWIDFMDVAGNDYALNGTAMDNYKLSVAHLDQYKISAIGHRAKVINDDKIKAIFYRSIPDVLWIDPDSDLYNDTNDNISYVRLRLSNGLENYFIISNQGKSAQEELQILLYENTYYQDSITISCLPIYYLEPNHRVIVVNNDTGIRGEYLIQSYSFSLAFDGMMSINASKATDRIYY